MGVDQMKQWLIKGAFVLGCAFLLWAAGRYLLGWFSPFLLGYLIAYILRPLAGFIRRHSRMSMRRASIVSAALFYFALGGGFWLLGTYLFGRAQQLGERLPELYATGIQPMFATITQRIEEVAGGRAFAGTVGAGASGALEIVNNALGGAATTASQRGLELLGNLAGKLPIAAIAVIFTILSSVLILADYPKIREGAINLIPQKHRETVLGLRDYMLGTIGKALRAYAIIMGGTFVVLAAGLWLLGRSNFLAVAALIALLDFLPIIGSGLVLLPWGIYLLLTGVTSAGVGIIALWVGISVLREVLEPRILGGQIGLHPLAAVTAMYAGLRIAGVGGLIAAPILCLLVRQLYRQGVFTVSE